MAQKLKFGNGTWATKKGSTLAYNDENNNYKPLPFTTTRNSIATRVNKEGLIEVVGNDVPRIDYTDSTDGVLLLEPSRTNLIPQSETFLAGWSKINGVVVSDEKEISPDGTLNASKLVFDGTNNGRIERAISGLTQGADYTVSVYARVASGTQEVIFGSFEEAPFTLTTEWQRLTRTQAENDTVAYPRLRCNDAATIEIYGFQLEQGSYATSYIPTSGSSVTRLADTASGSGNSEVFNDSEGVIFVDTAALVDDNTSKRISISDGSSNPNNLVCIDMSEYTNTIVGRIRTSNSEVAFLQSASQNQTQKNKIAVKYKVNDFALWINGFEVDTDNNGAVPIGLNDVSFDRGNGSNDFYGKTKEVAYYDEILTDLELETLTSYRSLNELVTELNLNTL